MGRKRKKAELKPFCFFCDRVFADEGVLIAHQKQVHFKCLECKKRLTGLLALLQHSLGVHKIEVKTIPGARADRDTVAHNILGMAGVPQELIDEKAAAEKAEKRAKDLAGGVLQEDDEEEEAPAPEAVAAAVQQQPPPPSQPGAHPAQQYGAYPPQHQYDGYAHGGYGQYGAPGGAPNPYAPRPPQPIYFQQRPAGYAPAPFGFPGAPQQLPTISFGLPPPPPPQPAHATMQLPPPPPPRPGALPIGGAAAAAAAYAGGVAAPAESSAPAAAAAAAPAGVVGTAAAPITLGAGGNSSATNLAQETAEVHFIFEEDESGLTMEEKRASLAKYRVA